MRFGGVIGRQTAVRVLRLLELLQQRRAWSGAELAEELGVSPRCVRRDIERVRELGYPVLASRGVGGGYRLVAGTELPPLPLSADEAVAVGVGLRGVAAGSPCGVEGAALSALVKLEQVLPRPLRARLTDLQAVSVALPGEVPAVDAGLLVQLAAACRDERAVVFDYLARDGAPSTRRVEPHRLVHGVRVWYLLAFDRDRDDWRTFRVDRLVAGTLQEADPFRARPLPQSDVSAWVDRARKVDAWPLRAAVWVDAPVEPVRAHFGSWAEVTRHGAGSRVELGSDRLDSMAAWLGMLPWDFRVISPPELRDAVRSVADRLQRASGEAEA